jgi:Uncharacterized membrane protein
MEFITYLIIPAIITIVGIAMLISRRDLFGAFIEGARDGLETGVKLLPSLVALIAAVSMFNASGAADAVTSLIEPFFSFLGVPAEILPFLIVRPISGGASTAMVSEIFNKYGADSFAGRCVSVIMGSSDTIIYIIAVYFTSVQIKKTRHTIPAAFLTMMFCVFASCLIIRLWFG